MTTNSLKEALDILNLEAVRAPDGTVSISEESLRRLATEQQLKDKVTEIQAQEAPKNLEQARGMARRYLQEQAGPQHMRPPGASVPANQPSAVESV